MQFFPKILVKYQASCQTAATEQVIYANVACDVLMDDKNFLLSYDVNDKNLFQKVNICEVPLRFYWQYRKHIPQGHFVAVLHLFMC